MTLVVAALGLLAGVLTTLAGQGGGLFLIVACSILVGPHEALAITAPALLLGNLHRAVLFRRFIHRGIAVRVVVGAIPGAFCGGLVAGAIPPWAIEALLVGLTVVAIARALSFQPSYVLFDEPTTSLDPVSARRVDRLIRDLSERLKVTSLVVSHDLPSIFGIADRIVMLYKGKVRLLGTPSDFRRTDDPVVQQFINGRAEGPIE